MADFTNSNNIPFPARVTDNRDVITMPTLWKWVAQGKVFEAGLGLEDAAKASIASIDDIYPVFSLQAPTSTTLLVIPILLKVGLAADGNALTEFSVAFTKPAALCATALTLSGTAMTSKHALYRKNPALTAQQATALFTVTASALVAADYVEYDRSIAVDAALTTGLVNFGEGPSNVKTYRFLDEGSPHVMTSGAAMLVYVKNGDTNATSKAYMQWAEVTEADLV
jgi:hypothetical protein